MSISTVAAASASSSSSASSNNALSSLGSNFNSFLTLLTTQLKNQSPTDPVDANQFTQQLVQFSQVQQQVNTNSYLEKILAAISGNQVSSAASYVGTTVQATGNKGALRSTGNAEFGYTLPLGAAKAEVSITNAAGQLVFNGLGSTNRGENNVLWDGLNSFTGQKEAAGVYTISVKALDASGNKADATPFTVGTVDSASIKDGNVILNIGALAIEASKVTNISNLTGKTS
jgi:flagellar basal-body rod modification protein FlgD